MIYADHAATARLSPAALKAMMPYLTDEYGNPSALYRPGHRARKAVEAAREVIARWIGAKPEEIYFTSGGTESDNWAINGVGADVFYTSPIEHHAVLRPIDAQKAAGKRVEYLPVDGEGTVSVGTLPDTPSKPKTLVSVMSANNEVGTIEPVGELCAAAHRCGAVFHTDAVQAIGHIPLDVRTWGIDLLSASAHKFGGPRGIGFLYVKRGIDLSPYLLRGAQERGMRAGTENVAAIAGMAAALRESVEECAQNVQKLYHLEAVLLEALERERVTYVRLGAKDHLPGFLSLAFPGAQSETILHRLDLCGICASAGAACTAGDTRVSHVLEALGLPEEILHGTIRLTLGADNSPEEAVVIAHALAKIVGEAR